MFNVKTSPFSAKTVIEKAFARYPILVNCEFSYLQELCEKMNEGRIKRVNLDDIKTEYDMKKAIWAAMEEKVWLVLDGLYSE